MYHGYWRTYHIGALLTATRFFAVQSEAEAVAVPDIHTEYRIIYRISGAVQYIYYLQATTITTVLSTTTLTSIKLLQYSTVAHLHLQAATALAVAADGLSGARAGRHCRGELLQRISE